MQINQDTKVFGSFSGKAGGFGTFIFNSAFQYMGINAIYKSFSVTNIPVAMCAMRELGFCGVAISSPHKVEVLEWIDVRTKETKHIGAANTILNVDGNLVAYNTDWLAAREILSRHPTSRIHILGDGGYSRAIQYAAKSLNKTVRIVSRKDWNLIPTLRDGLILMPHQ